MLEKKIVIIGGSIAGCAIGVLLQKLGFKFVILEKSSGIINEGSGINLPEAIINQGIDLDLFDQTIPRLPVTGRSFSRKENDSLKEFWTQSINLIALNWVHIYINLRKRIQQKSYFANTEVLSISKKDNIYHIETSKEIYQADLVIAADGINSIVRSQFFSCVSPKYAGYVAWRGVIDESNIVEKNIFEKNIPVSVFHGGHILLYKIPAKDYEITGKTLLNWVMYENRQNKSLSDLLIDKNDQTHTHSLPSGSLTKNHCSYLQNFSKHVLPNEIADIVCKTKQPFIQAVFDFQLPTYSNQKIIFVGDSAATLRPHSGSGVLKALTNAIKLYSLFKNNINETLESIVEKWCTEQNQINSEEVPKAKLMGEALVTHSPNWQVMNHEKTEKWWSEFMHGKNWYATNSNSQPLFFKEKKNEIEFKTKIASKL